MELLTIIDVFKETVDKFGGRNALIYQKDDIYRYVSWKEYYELSEMVACGFLGLEIKPGDGIGIMGFNSVHWFVSNMATIMVGAVVVGCYTTNSAEICQHIFNDSKTRIVIVENEGNLKKVMSIKDKTKIKNIIYWGQAENLNGKTIYKWDTFLKFCQHQRQKYNYLLQQRIKNLKPIDCCTLIYTSGTTGLPKGVMLSHDNIIWTTKTVCDMVGVNATTIEKIVSYLPLSHVAAQMMDIYMPLVCAGETWFAQPTALKGTLINSLNDAKPTIFLGVPRVWEKIMEKIQEAAKSLTGFKRKISQRAKDVGRKRKLNKKPSLEWRIYDRLVYQKVKKTLGLSNCKLFLTGAAPISDEILQYFASLNIRIYDIYGMSECSGPMTITYDGHYKMGSCGIPLVGTELKLNGETGEICTRGRHVMMGYLNQPEKTKEAIDGDGWLHSGDIGRIDDDGYLYIVGRIKELLVTSGGENIPPVIIENNMKSEIPIISNCMVVGDRRKYLTVLVTLKCKLDQENNPTDELDDVVVNIISSLGSNSTTVAEAVNDKVVLDIIQEGMKRVNQKSISNAQNVQKIKILPVDFSIAGGELGPTLKLKRNVVLEKYKDLVEELYQE